MKHKRKSAAAQNAACVLALAVMWSAVGVLTVKALDHPAEQQISGSEYMAQIAAYAPTQPDPAPLVKLIETPSPEPALLYDVPLAADLQNHVAITCEAHHIDPAVVVAMIWQESSFDANTIGDGGESFGLMQVQPKWHYQRMQALGCPDLLDPFQNVTVGVDYLAECLDRYDGDLAAALVAYNQGHFNGTVTDYALSVLDKAAELRGENNA